MCTTIYAMARVSRSLGLQHFWPGEPCVNGHACLRYSSNRACVECSAVQTRKWYGDEANAGKIKQKFKRYREKHLEYEKVRFSEWRKANPIAHKAATKRWRLENEEQFKAKQKEWWDANPERRRVYLNSYRARKKRNGGSHDVSDILALHKAQRGRCACCRRPLSNYHVDHIIALKRGGSNDKKNIQLLCPPCNSRKSARDPLEFMRSEGFLL